MATFRQSQNADKPIRKQSRIRGQQSWNSYTWVECLQNFGNSCLPSGQQRMYKREYRADGYFYKSLIMTMTGPRKGVHSVGRPGTYDTQLR